MEHREGPHGLQDHRRARLPCLWEVDSISGERIRASRAIGHHCERGTAGELLHIVVKKLGRIPSGGSWRLYSCSEAVKGRGIGFDYVHVAVDAPRRLEIRDPCCALRETSNEHSLSRPENLQQGQKSPVPNGTGDFFEEPFSGR